MRRLAKGLLICAAIALIVAGGFWLAAWIFIMRMDCGDNGAVADRVRAMDERALTRLYADARGLAASRQSMVLSDMYRGDELPSEFSGLRARYAIIEDDDVVVMLSGCVDDKVFLHVYHDAGDDSGRIVLSPGEWQASETLWRGKSAALSTR